MPVKGEGTITMAYGHEAAGQVSKKPYSGPQRPRGHMFHHDEEAKWNEVTQDATLKHPLLSKHQSGVKKRPSQFEQADQHDIRGEGVELAKVPAKRSESYFGRFNRFLGLSAEQAEEGERKASSSQRESPNFHQTPERRAPNLSPPHRQLREPKSDEKPVNITS